jgi:hypothetical protein
MIPQGDVLLRTLRLTAERVFAERTRDGRVVDADEIADDALAALRSTVQLGLEAEALRARLMACLADVRPTMDTAPRSSARIGR